MSLSQAILVSLAERAASGYDLTRRFDKSIGFFWRATHQQIYRVLARMQAEGLVDVTVEPGEGRPDRRVYHLTDEGRARLKEWTREPTAREQVRSEFAVKVRAMPFGDRDAVIDDIRRQRGLHAEQLDYYLADEALHFPEPGRVAEADLPAWLVLRGGIRQEQSYVAWCDEMLAVLDRTTEPTHTPIAG
ncbi:PadR family transcriptional regulator [Leekyejoonella antrihumi]|uniref:PadR family transcriptional regulator n=1 Tax=Leekyejoonella antrihumi TaxID=1660198 RepID=A0A563DZR7_9MICO|nr:PadR family transcriptional regulator [Leekyejoonella antrihumi]TWP35463.1 PadR family transcriptional regulator [Leekyejoonella antrihumi]